MNFSYFIPIINFGPLKDTIFTQTLPLEKMNDLIIGKFAKFEVLRQIFSNGKIIEESSSIIEFKNNLWINRTGEEFIWNSTMRDNQTCFIETHINLLEGRGIKDTMLPGFYVFYNNKKYKTYLSCGNYKYANIRVIMQMEEFGKWVDGFPAISIDYDLKTTYSLIIINPYVGNSSFDIEVNELNLFHCIKVKSRSVGIFDFSSLIKNNWTGQFYINGTKRGIIYLINHKIGNIYNISTLEHTDPFRAELTYKPKLQHLRSNIHEQIKKLKEHWKSEKIM